MNESQSTLRQLQDIIDRSAASAGPAMAQNFVSPEWRMSAKEFVEFWADGRMAAISTVSSGGDVHSAPLEPILRDGRFYVPTFADSVRLRDHRANPRCSITSWEGPYRAVIVYGDALVVLHDPVGRTSEVDEEQALPRDGVVTVEITPTRIYGIRPPEGHHAAG